MHVNTAAAVFLASVRTFTFGELQKNEHFRKSIQTLRTLLKFVCYKGYIKN